MPGSCGTSWQGGAGPARDVVLLNAGAALFVAGRAARLGDGLSAAAAAIDSGAARRTLDALVRWSGGPPVTPAEKRT